MTEILSVRNLNTTAKGYLDMSRPIAMVASDRLHKTIASKEGGSVADTLKTSTELLGVIKSTKSFELDQVWKRMEKVFNGGQPLKTTSKTDMAKFQTAFSLFYNMLDTIDASSTNSLELFEFQNSYLSAQEHVINRILPGQSGKDLRNLQKIMDTINSRLGKVVDRFNERIDAGEIGGPKL